MLTVTGDPVKNTAVGVSEQQAGRPLSASLSTDYMGDGRLDGIGPDQAVAQEQSGAAMSLDRRAAVR